MQGSNMLMLLFLFVSVHSQALFAFMGSYLVSLSFFTARHVGIYFFNVFIAMP